MLPDLSVNAIAENYRTGIETEFEKLLNEIPRGMPESVVELCRNLASLILIAKNSEFDSARRPDDLSKEAAFFEAKCTEKKLVAFYTVSNCAQSYR